MNKVRLIDLGEVSGLRSQAVYHAVGANMTVQQSDTMLLMVPQDRFVSIGLYQELERNVNIEFCREHDIPVYRRKLGGRALLVDGGQQLFQMVSHKRRARRSVTRVYQDILRVAVETYQSMGVDAHYLPVSDVYVRNCRIGGSAIGRLDSAIVLASGLVFEQDTSVVSAALTPEEKEYTCVSRELGKATNRTEALKDFLAIYERKMEVEFEEGELTDEELEAVEEAEQEISAEGWVLDVDHRIAELKQDTDDTIRLGEAVNEIEGGLIRATVRVKGDVIEGLVLSGDFFFYEDHRHGLEQAFICTTNEWEDLMTVAENYYLVHEVDSPGVNPADWVTTVSKAFHEALS